MPSVDPWWEDMECRDADPAIFEEPRNLRTARSWAEPALAYCNRCPVRERCLDEALRQPDYMAREFTQRHVVGGLLPREFDQLRRRRGYAV